MSAKQSPVQVRFNGSIATLVMNRPENRNSLSQAMMDAILEGLDSTERREGTRAVILAARGPVFCAGHDLKEMRRHRETDGDGGRTHHDALFEKCARLMVRIVRFPCPVIAQVQGIATAAGCQLVASCDLAYAAKEAKFATPGVNIGLFCSTPMVALSRNITRKHAMEMLLTGDMISAEKAASVGLINDWTTAEQLEQKTQEIARQIAGKAPSPVRMGKEAFYIQDEKSLDDAYAYTARIMTENMMIEEAGEGISAFLDKRPPRWAGQ